MSEWRSFQHTPPYHYEIRGTGVVCVPDYEVIEWKRGYNQDGEPNVANVADLASPAMDAWNIYDVYWRPVM